MKKLFFLLMFYSISLIGYTKYRPDTNKRLCTDFGIGSAQRECLKEVPVTNTYKTLRCKKWTAKATDEDKKCTQGSYAAGGYYSVDPKDPYYRYTQKCAETIQNKDICELTEESTVVRPVKGQFGAVKTICEEYSKPKKIKGSTLKAYGNSNIAYPYVCYAKPPQDYDYKSGDVYTSLTKEDRQQLKDLLAYMQAKDTDTIGDVVQEIAQVAFKSGNDTLPEFKYKLKYLDLPAYLILLDIPGTFNKDGKQLKRSIPCPQDPLKEENKHAVVKELGIEMWGACPNEVGQ